MSKVTDCARALGEAIVASEEYKNMQVTESAAMSDPAVAEGMARYMELKNKLSCVSTYKGTNLNLRVPSSWPHVILITSQMSHLQFHSSDVSITFEL